MVHNLYYINTIEDTVSISPANFGQDVNKTALEALRKKYERTLDRDLGIIVTVFNVRDVSDGMILPGDPSTRHTATFDVLSFNLEIDEIVAGEVSELADFGCFVRLGPLDGLVHLSQITSDFISYDKKSSAFVSKNTGRSLKKGDKVFAKVSSISLKAGIKDAKISLTMRPDGLGKPEWAKEPKREYRKGARKGGPRGKK